MRKTVDVPDLCQIGVYRIGFACYRQAQFRIAAEINGVPGIQTCSNHLGQAIVAATVRSRRTSVLIAALANHPAPTD